MKTKNLLKKMFAVVSCFAMIYTVNAQTATSLADLQTKFAAAVAAGTPATINIGAAMVITTDVSFVSTGDTITLNIVPFNFSVTSGTLTIGNKVKITSAGTTAGALQAAGGTIILNPGCAISATTGNTVQALVGGTVIVNGGQIFSTATSPIVSAGGNVIINGGSIASSNYPAVAAGMAINALPTGGYVTIYGGKIYTTATGISRGIVVDYNGVCTLNGGEVRSDMGGGRAISINGTNAGGKLYINGGIVSALGATGRAIQLDNNNAMLWVSGSPTITGGLEAIMVQKNGVVVLAGTPTLTGVIGTNSATSKLYDCRNLAAITATPGTGYYTAAQSVTLAGATGNILKYVNTTSAASATTVAASIKYTTDGTDPVTTSADYSAAVSAAVPSVLKAAPYIDASTIGVVSTFSYYMSGTPGTGAPKPTVDPTKVASIFSDAYPSEAGAGTNFNPGWGQTTVGSIIKIGTDNVLKYANLNYQGTQFANPVNAGDLKYLHFDAFTGNETSLQITPISPASPNNAEHLVTVAAPNFNVWNSYDIPVTSFTGVDMSNIIQLKVLGSGGKTIYLDNIYFWTDAVADTQAPTAFTAIKTTVKSDEIDFTLNATDNSGVVFFEITYGTTTVRTSSKSGVDKAFALTGLSGSTDYSFSVVAKDRTGNVVASGPIVITATTLTAMPAAPTPTIDALKVMSIYSDTYTSIMKSTGWEDWYGNTFSTILLGGNSTLKDIASCCFGVSFATTTIDVSSMTKLHVDIYPVTPTTMTFGFITATTTPQKILTLVPGKWNAIDLSLADLKTEFPTADYTQVKQMSFSPAVGTFYLDNLYFYNDVNTGLFSVDASSTVKFFPTQVSSNLNIAAETMINEVVIRNLIGQSVKAITLNNQNTTVDLSNFAAGNYFVTVKLENGQSLTQKIVKL